MRKINLFVFVLAAVSFFCGCASCEKAGNNLATSAPVLAPVAGCPVSFAEGKWSSDEWMMVKSSRTPYIGKWIQNADHIQNLIPQEYSDPKQLLGIDSYTSMVWKEPVSGNFVVASTMDFEHEMAPLLVLADELGTDANSYPEFRQHWEIVLWNEGINVWHHRYIDGKQNWHLASSIKLPFLPKTKYELKTEVRRRADGAELTIICGDAKFTYIEHEFPATVRAGITGCEGINRFYDFNICPLK